jgi:hypothetical protein
MNHFVVKMAALITESTEHRHQKILREYGKQV